MVFKRKTVLLLINIYGIYMITVSEENVYIQSATLNGKTWKPCRK